MPHPKQLTTAHDLALIAKAALENSDLRKIVSSNTYPWKSRAWQGQLKIRIICYRAYQGAIGVKTGNTREAGYCLVAAANEARNIYRGSLEEPRKSRLGICHEATRLWVQHVISS